MRQRLLLDAADRAPRLGFLLGGLHVLLADAFEGADKKPPVPHAGLAGFPPGRRIGRSVAAPWRRCAGKHPGSKFCRDIARRQQRHCPAKFRPSSEPHESTAHRRNRGGNEKWTSKEGSCHRMTPAFTGVANQFACRLPRRLTTGAPSAAGFLRMRSSKTEAGS